MVGSEGYLNNQEIYFIKEGLYLLRKQFVKSNIPNDPDLEALRQLQFHIDKSEHIVLRK